MTIAVDLGRLANIQTHSCCFVHYSQGSFLCFVYALFDCIELFVTPMHDYTRPLKSSLFVFKGLLN